MSIYFSDLTNNVILMAYLVLLFLYASNSYTTQSPKKFAIHRIRVLFIVSLPFYYCIKSRVNVLLCAYKYTQLY